LCSPPPSDQGSWEEFDEQRKLNTISRWLGSAAIGSLLVVLAFRRLGGAWRAKHALPRIGRLPTTASADGSLDGAMAAAASHGPCQTSRHWLRHLAARRVTLGAWDVRTNWGMMSIWLVWAAYQVVMTLVRPRSPMYLTLPGGSAA